MNNKSIYCQVCYLKINQQQRKLIQCQSCEQDMCIQCWVSCILTKFIYPQCPFCNHQIAFVYIVKKIMTKQNKELLEKHITSMLLIQQQQSFSLLQNDLKVYQAVQKLKKQYNQLTQELNQIRTEIKPFEQDMFPDQIDQNNIEFVLNDLVDMKLKEFNERSQFIALQEQKKYLQIRLTNISIYSNQMTKQCPYQDCSGMLENQNAVSQCILCKKYVCNQCELPYMNDHICDVNVLQTLQTLKDIKTKQCPNCKISVEKVSGCNDMFCIKCGTFFNWKTLNIIKNRILHNPDHLQYIQQNTNQHCQLPTWRKINDMWRSLDLDYIEYRQLLKLINRMQNTLFIYSPESLQTRDKQNKLQFLSNEINEQIFIKNAIEINDINIYQGLSLPYIQMYTDNIKDMINIIETNKYEINVLSTIKEHDVITQQINQKLKKMGLVKTKYLRLLSTN